MYNTKDCGSSPSMFVALQDLALRGDLEVRKEAEGALWQLKDHERKVDVVVKAEGDSGEKYPGVAPVNVYCNHYF